MVTLSPNFPYAYRDTKSYGIPSPCVTLHPLNHPKPLLNKEIHGMTKDAGGSCVTPQRIKPTFRPTPEEPPILKGEHPMTATASQLAQIPDALIFARHRPKQIQNLHAWCEQHKSRPTFAQLEEERRRRQDAGRNRRKETSR